MGALTPEVMAEIDSMSYEEMLRLWRYAEVGHPLFAGEVGGYFGDKMWEKKAKVSLKDRSMISKKIDWPKDKGGEI